MALNASSLVPLYDLPEASLRALAASLRGGPLSLGLSASAMQPIAGQAAPRVLASLAGLIADGATIDQLGFIVELLAGQRARLGDAALLFGLVLSGPDVPGVPAADTGAVMQTLISEARQSILLVGYAVHNGKRLFEPLAKRIDENPGLNVTLCLDISRGHQDTTTADDLVRRFADEFRGKHWPRPCLPIVYYDPRALAPIGQERASLHAKCVIVDRQAALVTSANFTEAAQQRNIEAGILVRHAPLVERLSLYFETLIQNGALRRCLFPPR